MRGLAEVPNPSALFLGDRQREITGSAVFAGIEGTRPMLVEIQALVAPSTLGTPRRAVVGWDGNRLAMVLAVLEARCGVPIGANDIYLNVAGGLRIAEPAADLAVAAALISALAREPVPADTVVFGEIGLSGEIRPVSQTDARLKEAEKLGFAAALTPPRRGRAKEKPGVSPGIQPREIGASAQPGGDVREGARRRAQARRRRGRRPAVNEFDLGIIVFIGLSGLFAFARGFVKEVLSIIAWFGASLAALYAFPYLRPLAAALQPVAGSGRRQLEPGRLHHRAGHPGLHHRGGVAARQGQPAFGDRPHAGPGLRPGARRAPGRPDLHRAQYRAARPGRGAAVVFPGPHQAAAGGRGRARSGSWRRIRCTSRNLGRGISVEQELDDALKAFSRPKSAAPARGFRARLFAAGPAQHGQADPAESGALINHPAGRRSRARACHAPMEVAPELAEDWRKHHLPCRRPSVGAI